MFEFVVIDTARLKVIAKIDETMKQKKDSLVCCGSPKFKHILKWVVP